MIPSSHHNVCFFIVGKMVMECSYIRDGYHEPITVCFNYRWHGLAHDFPFDRH